MGTAVKEEPETYWHSLYCPILSIHAKAEMPVQCPRWLCAFWDSKGNGCAIYFALVALTRKFDRDLGFL